jgi:inorganic pyrophosphatase
VSKLPPHQMAMIRRFFQDYKQLEGKEVDVDEILPAAKAYPVIENALKEYKKKFPRNPSSRSNRWDT